MLRPDRHPADHMAIRVGVGLNVLNNMNLPTPNPLAQTRICRLAASAGCQCGLMLTLCLTIHWQPERPSRIPALALVVRVL